MSFRRVRVAPATLCLLATLSAGAAMATELLTKAARTSVVDATVARLTSTYVDESDAGRIAAALHARETANTPITPR